METPNLFYFIVYPGGDASKLKVVDLSYDALSERASWKSVNDRDFTEPEEAIEYARALAKKFNLEYIPFKSRYDDGKNEKGSGSHPHLSL